MKLEELQGSITPHKKGEVNMNFGGVDKSIATTKGILVNIY